MTHAQIEAAVQAIVADILRDFTDRRGLRQAWDDIDEDIQDEIKIAWRLLVEAHLRAIGGDQP